MRFFPFLDESPVILRTTPGASKERRETRGSCPPPRLAPNMAHASQRNQSPARAGGEWWFLTRPACRTRSVAGGDRLSPAVVGAPARFYRLAVGRLRRSCGRRALTVGHDPGPAGRPPARFLPRS